MFGRQLWRFFSFHFFSLSFHSSLFQPVSFSLFCTAWYHFRVSLLRFSVVRKCVCVCVLSCRVQCDLLRNHVHCTVYFVLPTDDVNVSRLVYTTFSIVQASRIQVVAVYTPLEGKEIIYFRFLTISHISLLLEHTHTHSLKRGSINEIDNTI